MNSTLNTGVVGMQRGMQSMQSAAHKIATAGVVPNEPSTADSALAASEVSRVAGSPSSASSNSSTYSSSSSQSFSMDLSELATSMVELSQSRHQVEASAVVVKVADEVLGSLIDITT